MSAKVTTKQDLNKISKLALFLASFNEEDVELNTKQKARLKNIKKEIILLNRSVLYELLCEERLSIDNVASKSNMTSSELLEFWHSDIETIGDPEDKPRVIVNPDIAQIRVNDAGFRTAVVNALERENVYTVEQLAQLTIRQLKSLYNLGDLGIRELQAYAELNGFKFAT